MSVPPKPSPTITVIVAVYNGAKTLQQCISSVSDQSYGHKQLIIIDGASRDDTVEILKLNDCVIDYWISESDTGIYSAWNKALMRTAGDWVCFLGSDDFFTDKRVLEVMAEKLVAAPRHINVVYGQTMLLTESGSELFRVGQPWEKMKRRFTQVMCLPHPAVMHRHSLFLQHGTFDESFRIAADYEFLLRELKFGNAVFIPEVTLTAMRQGGISSTPANTILSLEEVRRAQRKHGILMPGRMWTLALARAYIRLFLWNSIGEKLTRKLLDIGRSLLRLPPYWTKM